ncbi:MAG: glycosyltransferase family 4 protein [Brooklawnia sp.]|jgi:glycosyltransferase involved in cell wall biosynthesis
MRLLYVIDSLAPGGAETSLVEMTPGLIRHGIDLHVLSLTSRLDLAEALTDAGARVHQAGSPHGRTGNVRAVVKIGREVKPDLIHTTLFEADVAGRIGARILGIPSSTSLVSDSYDASHYAESNRWKLHAARTLDATTARFATRIHANSTAIARSVPPRIRINPEIVDVIPRGRDPERFHFQPIEAREAIRRELGLRESTKVIIAIGRLEPPKGLHHLLEAIPRIAQVTPDACLIIVGRDGRASQELRHQAASLPLEVKFLGHRTDIPQLLAGADVLAFPSEREGSPGTLIEALAVGTPIVASDIPPNLEVLGNGPVPTGLIAQSRNPRALADAILRAFTDTESAKQRARSGRARFDALFTIDAIAAEMAAFFIDVANQGSPQTGSADLSVGSGA